MAQLHVDRSLARKIESAGWATFFIWVGAALLADVGWTWALIGTGMIVLAVQMALYLRGERIDAFMTAVGAVLVGGSIADLYGSPWSVIPAFLIVIGLAMLVDALRRTAHKPQPKV